MGATIFIESADGINFDTAKITEAIKSNVSGIGSRYDLFVVKFPDGRVLCSHGTDDGVQGGRQKIIADIGNAATGLADSQRGAPAISVNYCPQTLTQSCLCEFYT